MRRVIVQGVVSIVEANPLPEGVAAWWLRVNNGPGDSFYGVVHWHALESRAISKLVSFFLLCSRKEHRP